MESKESEQLVVVKSGPPPFGTVGTVSLKWLKKFGKTPIRRRPKRNKKKEDK
jgi:hypothetical protein